MTFMRLAMAVVCVSCLPSAALAQGFFEAEEPSIGRQMEVRSTYIVEFDPDVDFRDVEGKARGLVARFNGRMKHVYGHAYRGFAVRMSGTAMARLLSAENTDVIRVTRDGFVSLQAPPCKGRNKNDPGCPGNEEPVDEGPTGGSCDELVWGVARVTSLAPNDDCKGYKDSGLGRYRSATDPGLSSNPLKICVLDSGVAPHPDLNLHPIRHNFISGESDADLNGHGTHVAGTIAAKANDEGVVGVAPGAFITSIKVLDRNGSGSYSGIIAGIDEAAQLGCDVANVSLGGGRSDAVDQAVQCAAGIGEGCGSNSVMFALSAGNDSADSDTKSPASASMNDVDGIYTIAAFAEGDSWASFSNYNDDVIPLSDGDPEPPLVDFALPGVSVKSTLPNNSYGTYNGTSMAAPHMAGLLVRYLVDRSASVPIENDAFDPGGSVTRESGRGRRRTAQESYIIPADNSAPGS